MVRVVLVFALSLGPAWQIEAIEPPLFEPKKGYYHARGAKVDAEWSLDRDEVPVDGEIMASLTIRGAVNPDEILRPDLNQASTQDGRLFTDFFQIEDMPTTRPSKDAKVVVFVYRLRPRGREVNRLPTLEFWYDTGRQGGNPFARTRAAGVPIHVTEAGPKHQVASIPLDEPNFLFADPPTAGVLERGPWKPTRTAWLVSIFSCPILALVWLTLWRWRYPGALRFTQIRRHRSFHRALTTIRSSHRNNDPARVISDAILGYLSTRLFLPGGIDTPNDLEQSLKNTILAGLASHKIAMFLRECFEVRFAQHFDLPADLALRAEKLLFEIEAIP